MTTIAAGQSGSYTFTELSNVTVSLDSGEHALVVVLSSAGDQLFSDRASSTKTIGPFPTGAVLTVTADGAAVDYAVSTAKADGNFASYTGKEAVSYATDPITGLDVLDAGSRSAAKASGLSFTNGVGPTAVLHPIGNPAAGAGLSVLRTWGYRATVGSRPIAAQIVIGNMEATPPTVVHACVCVSSTIGSPAYERPTGHTWANLTFSAAASTTAPSRVAAATPGYLASDTVSLVASPARTDGPGYMVFLNIVPGVALETFSYNIANGTASAASDVDTTYQASLPAGQIMKIRRVDGDYATAATGDTFPASTAQNNMPIFYLILTLENGATVVLNSGDSIAMGQCTAGGLGNAVDIATRGLCEVDQEVYQVNQGQPGQTTTTYSAQTILMLPIIKPKFLTYRIWSPNDVNAASPNVTQATIDTMKRNAVAVYNAFMANGGERMFFIGPTPLNTLTTYGAYTAQQRANMDALRLSMRTWGMELNWSRLEFIDIESIYSDGAVPAKFIASLSDDGLHPNAAGALLESVPVRAAMAPWVG